MDESSPIIGALAELGFELLQDEVKHRCTKLEKTPLGEMIRIAARRREQIQSEKRQATSEDVRDFVREITPIARRAQQVNRLADEEE